MPGSLPYKKRHILYTTLCTLLSFFLLFFFRNADDNRLTSWKWVFADINLIWFVPFIFLGIIFVYALLNLPAARRRPVLFLFIASFSICAIFWNVPEVIVDTSRYFTQAKHLELYGINYFFAEWGRTINAWTDLPLVPFLYGLIFKFFGEARVFIQAFTALIFSMTVVVTYLTGKTLWDKDTGFFAGVLLWGIPYIFSQTPLMLVDVPTMFFLTLSIYTFIKALQEGKAWIALSGMSIFCALFSKYSAWVMLSVLGVVLLVYLIQDSKQGRSNAMSRSLLVALIAGISAGALFAFKYDIVAGQITFLREYQAPGLRRWGESFVSTFLYQIHPFITIAALYSGYEAFRKKDLKFLIISWLILLIIILQIRRARYVMVVFPMLALMASYGLQKIKTIDIRRYLTSCIVAVSLVTAMFAYLPFLRSMGMVNIKDAGSFLDSIEAETAEVFTVPLAMSVINSSIAVPILDLYTSKDILYHYDDNFSWPLEEIETSPLRFTWEYKNPGYYADNKKVPTASPIVVISNSDVMVLPEGLEEKLKGYEKVRVFETTTGLFLYSPVVTIYLPAKS